MDVNATRNNGGVLVNWAEGNQQQQRVSENRAVKVETETKQDDMQKQDKEKGQENKKKLTPKDVKPAIATMNQFMEYMTADLHFKMHERTDTVMVQLRSEKDNRVLREYPAKEFLDMMANVHDAIGLILDKKV